MAEISDIQLNNISTRLEKISARMGSFGNSLTTISNQLSEASSLERMKEQQQLSRDRQLAEQELRAGKESVFESKMQNALIKPMERVSAPVQSVFERLKTFFLSMFGAWITEQGFQTIQAYIQGNVKKLEEIRDNVLNAFRKIFTVYAGIKVGITSIIRIIRGIGGFIFNNVYQGLIARPFNALMTAIKNAITRAGNLIRGMFGRAPKPTTKPPTTKPMKPGLTGPGLLGGLFSGVQAFMNFKNGENIDGIMNAALLLPAPPIVRALLTAGIIADDIAEAFGKNLIGKDPNQVKKGQEILAELEKQKNKDSKKAQTSSVKTEPTEGLMGDKKDDKKGVEANTAQASFMTEDELKKSGNGSTSASPPEAQVSSTSNGSSTPAQISSTPKGDVSGSVGPEPKSEPIIEVLPPSQEQQSVPVEAASQASSIPNIKSSNIENFYTLYSQINYNVVV